MIGNVIKIRKNKTTYLSKLLFLKNPIIPNGNRAKNIGKEAKAVDFMKVNMTSFGRRSTVPDE